MKGWGPKSSVCPSKYRETKLFGGIPRDFAGISRECPKSLSKRGLCSILVPYRRRRGEFKTLNYNPAEAPGKKGAGKKCSESAGSTQGAEESAEKVLQASSFCTASTEAHSLEALFRHFPRHPVWSRHFFRHFLARGFGTSVAGR